MEDINNHECLNKGTACWIHSISLLVCSMKPPGEVRPVLTVQSPAVPSHLIQPSPDAAETEASVVPPFLTFLFSLLFLTLFCSLPTAPLCYHFMRRSLVGGQLGKSRQLPANVLGPEWVMEIIFMRNNILKSSYFVFKIILSHLRLLIICFYFAFFCTLNVRYMWLIWFFTNDKKPTRYIYLSFLAFELVERLKGNLYWSIILQRWRNK